MIQSRSYAFCFDASRTHDAKYSTPGTKQELPKLATASIGDAVDMNALPGVQKLRAAASVAPQLADRSVSSNRNGDFVKSLLASPTRVASVQLQLHTPGSRARRRRTKKADSVTESKRAHESDHFARVQGTSTRVSRREHALQAARQRYASQSYTVPATSSIFMPKESQAVTSDQLTSSLHLSGAHLAHTGGRSSGHGRTPAHGDNLPDRLRLGSQVSPHHETSAPELYQLGYPGEGFVDDQPDSAEPTAGGVFRFGGAADHHHALHQDSGIGHGWLGGHMASSLDSLPRSMVGGDAEPTSTRGAAHIKAPTPLGAARASHTAPGGSALLSTGSGTGAARASHTAPGGSALLSTGSGTGAARASHTAPGGSALLSTGSGTGAARASHTAPGGSALLSTGSGTGARASESQRSATAGSGFVGAPGASQSAGGSYTRVGFGSMANSTRPSATDPHGHLLGPSVPRSVFSSPSSSTIGRAVGVVSSGGSQGGPSDPMHQYRHQKQQQQQQYYQQQQQQLLPPGALATLHRAVDSANSGRVFLPSQPSNRRAGDVTGRASAHAGSSMHPSASDGSLVFVPSKVTVGLGGKHGKKRHRRRKNAGSLLDQNAGSPLGRRRHRGMGAGYSQQCQSTPALAAQASNAATGQQQAVRSVAAAKSRNQGKLHREHAPPNAHARTADGRRRVDAIGLHAGPSTSQQYLAQLKQAVPLGSPMRLGRPAGGFPITPTGGSPADPVVAVSYGKLHGAGGGSSRKPTNRAATRTIDTSDRTNDMTAQQSSKSPFGAGWTGLRRPAPSRGSPTAAKLQYVPADGLDASSRQAGAAPSSASQSSIRDGRYGPVPTSRDGGGDGLLLHEAQSRGGVGHGGLGQVELQGSRSVIEGGAYQNEETSAVEYAAEQFESAESVFDREEKAAERSGVEGGQSKDAVDLLHPSGATTGRSASRHSISGGGSRRSAFRPGPSIDSTSSVLSGDAASEAASAGGRGQPWANGLGHPSVDSLPVESPQPGKYAVEKTAPSREPKQPSKRRSKPKPSKLRTPHAASEANDVPDPKTPWGAGYHATSAKVVKGGGFQLQRGASNGQLADYAGLVVKGSRSAGSEQSPGVEPGSGSPKGINSLAQGSRASFDSIPVPAEDQEGRSSSKRAGMESMQTAGGGAASGVIVSGDQHDQDSSNANGACSEAAGVAGPRERNETLQRDSNLSMGQDSLISTNGGQESRIHATESLSPRAVGAAALVNGEGRGTDEESSLFEGSPGYTGTVLGQGGSSTPKGSVAFLDDGFARVEPSSPAGASMATFGQAGRRWSVGTMGSTRSGGSKEGLASPARQGAGFPGEERTGESTATAASGEHRAAAQKVNTESASRQRPRSRSAVKRARAEATRRQKADVPVPAMADRRIFRPSGGLGITFKRTSKPRLYDVSSDAGLQSSAGTGLGSGYPVLLSPQEAARRSMIRTRQELRGGGAALRMLTRGTQQGGAGSNATHAPMSSPMRVPGKGDLPSPRTAGESLRRVAAGMGAPSIAAMILTEDSGDAAHAGSGARSRPATILSEEDAARARGAANGPVTQSSMKRRPQPLPAIGAAKHKPVHAATGGHKTAASHQDISSSSPAATSGRGSASSAQSKPCKQSVGDSRGAYHENHDEGRDRSQSPVRLTVARMSPTPSEVDEDGQPSPTASAMSASPSAWRRSTRPGSASGYTQPASLVEGGSSSASIGAHVTDRSKDKKAGIASDLADGNGSTRAVAKQSSGCIYAVSPRKGNERLPANQAAVGDPTIRAAVERPRHQIKHLPNVLLGASSPSQHEVRQGGPLYSKRHDRGTHAAVRPMQPLGGGWPGRMVADKGMPQGHQHDYTAHIAASGRTASNARKPKSIAKLKTDAETRHNDGAPAVTVSLLSNASMSIPSMQPTGPLGAPARATMAPDAIKHQGRLPLKQSSSAYRASPGMPGTEQAASWGPEEADPGEAGASTEVIVAAMVPLGDGPILRASPTQSLSLRYPAGSSGYAPPAGLGQFSYYGPRIAPTLERPHPQQASFTSDGGGDFAAGDSSSSSSQVHGYEALVQAMSSRPVLVHTRPSLVGSTTRGRGAVERKGQGNKKGEEKGESSQSKSPKPTRRQVHAQSHGKTQSSVARARSRKLAEHAAQAREEAKATGVAHSEDALIDLRPQSRALRSRGASRSSRGAGHGGRGRASSKGTGGDALLHEEPSAGMAGFRDSIYSDGSSVLGAIAGLGGQGGGTISLVDDGASGVLSSADPHV